ncbi:MAG: MoxR family ATPase [Pirellulaceae bacterium]
MEFTQPPTGAEAAIEKLRQSRLDIEEQLRRVLVGQEEAIEQLLIALFSGGHCLITGPPGLAKTLLVRTVAQLFHLDFRRIQFTPDLMPSDIIGTEILIEDDQHRRSLKFVSGPIFANVVLADEINRTPPKTQAALLEAMQEKQVTAAGHCHELPRPFFVLATQNPIEMEGTYPLPEAQLDRFLFNIVVDYLPEDDEVLVVQRTTRGGAEPLSPMFTAEDLLAFHEISAQVPIGEPLVRYAVQLASASRPSRPGVPDFVNEWVAWGAGLRGAQSLVLGAKARALLKGRMHVSIEDIQALAFPALRHRILTSYRAEADGVTVDDVIRKLIETISAP